MSITFTGGPTIKQLLVGVRGFEPPTTATPLRCATRLRYTPKTVDLEILREKYGSGNICNRLPIVKKNSGNRRNIQV